MDDVTKNIINDLRASGLARNEFRVKRRRIWRNGRTSAGQRRYEYDGYSITLLCGKERMWEVAPALSERFACTRLVLEGKPAHLIVRYGEPGLSDWVV